MTARRASSKNAAKPLIAASEWNAAAALASVRDDLPFNKQDIRRIRQTLLCPDAALLPRVPGAGDVIDGPQGRYQIMHNGLKVVADGYLGPWLTELVRLLRGVHEPQEERAFLEILKHVPAGGTMIELGSWWAYYSLWFQQSVPQARTYMIEPDPNNMEVGVRNFALNRMSGIHINAAIGRVSQTSIMYRCFESDNIERPIPVLSVDDLIEREGVTAVDVLLSDIQGVELDMLEGARKSIARGLIRFVVISTHHHSISDDPLMHQKCLGFLEQQGAYLLAEHSIPESYSGDGLLVASFRAEDRLLPAIQLSRNTARNSLFGELEYDLVRALNETKETREHWEHALHSKELERLETQRELERTRAALDAKERDRRTLEKEMHRHAKDLEWFARALKEKETEVALLGAEKQRLETMIAGVDAAVQDMEIERAAIEQERNALSQPLDELRLRILQTEADASIRLQDLRDRLLQAEVDSSGRLHALNEMYASVSWRITAPLRALHIRELVRGGLRRVVGVLRRRPATSAALTELRSRMPRLWWQVARNNKGVTESVAPLRSLDLLMPPQINLRPLAEDQERLGALFHRELARLDPNEGEAEQ